jgi:hypothetical protein
MAQPGIEKTPQVPGLMELVALLPNITERAGLDLPSFCKILQNLCLQLNSSNGKDLEVLVDLLFSHGFLLSRDPF